MALWTGKSKGTPWGYSVFVAILRRFGVLPAYVLLRFVAFYFFLFSARTSRPIFGFFRRRIGYGFWKSVGSIYKSYYQVGQRIIDRVVVMAGIPSPFTFDFDGEENLRDMVRGGRGGLLLSGHLGSWDVAGHLLERLGTTIHVVIFDGEHERIKAYLDSVTGERNLGVIVIRDDLSHIYEISEALRKNEFVCILADRFLEGTKTLPTGFMGSPARFPAGPFVLAAHFKVPVCWVFAAKESPTHYHLFASKPVEYWSSKKAALMQEMLADFSQELEQKARAYPTQWFNFYDFWKQ